MNTWNYRKGTSPHFQGQVSNETTGKTIAITYDDEQGENGSLISAAPELLESLESLHDACEYWDDQDDPVLQAARSALAKAKGGV